MEFHEVIVLLPNLRYIDSKIYFISKHPEKCNIKKIKTFIKNFQIDIESLHKRITYNGKQIDYDIINEAHKDGLKVKIMYNINDLEIYIQQIAKNTEGDILGIINNEIKSVKYDDDFEEDLDNESYVSFDKKSFEDDQYDEDIYEDEEDYEEY